MLLSASLPILTLMGQKYKARNLENVHGGISFYYFEVYPCFEIIGVWIKCIRLFFNVLTSPYPQPLVNRMPTRLQSEVALTPVLDLSDINALRNVIGLVPCLSTFSNFSPICTRCESPCLCQIPGRKLRSKAELEEVAQAMASRDEANNIRKIQHLSHLLFIVST